MTRNPRAFMPKEAVKEAVTYEIHKYNDIHCEDVDDGQGNTVTRAGALRFKGVVTAAMDELMKSPERDDGKTAAETPTNLDPLRYGGGGGGHPSCTVAPAATFSPLRPSPLNEDDSEVGGYDELQPQLSLQGDAKGDGKHVRGGKAIRASNGGAEPEEDEEDDDAYSDAAAGSPITTITDAITDYGPDLCEFCDEDASECDDGDDRRKELPSSAAAAAAGSSSQMDVKFDVIVVANKKCLEAVEKATGKMLPRPAKWRKKIRIRIQLYVSAVCFTAMIMTNIPWTTTTLTTMIDDNDDDDDDDDDDDNTGEQEIFSKNTLC
eukprot:jgi/Bigna1/136259/aug1.33_g10967